MENVLKELEVGLMYSNEDIYKSLGVGNAGGVRVQLDRDQVVRRMVVMTSVPSARQARENPYHDRIEGDVLVYTGAGREGDQHLAGVNSRIPQQPTSWFPIYGFLLTGNRRDRSVGPNRWRFLGMLEYLRHYQEPQIDSLGQLRFVWCFELYVHNQICNIDIQHDAAIVAGMFSETRDRGGVEFADREIGESAVATHSEKQGRTSLEIETMRARLLTLQPERFEHIVKDLLVASGFARVSVTRYSQDGGIDVNAFASPLMWPLDGLMVQVQAKRWLRTVGRKEVAELRGSLQPFARGAIVTTSQYSKAALYEACEPGKNPITLIDGGRLASIILDQKGDLAFESRGESSL